MKSDIGHCNQDVESDRRHPCQYDVEKAFLGAKGYQYQVIHKNRQAKHRRKSISAKLNFEKGLGSNFYLANGALLRKLLLTEAIAIGLTCLCL